MKPTQVTRSRECQRPYWATLYSVSPYSRTFPCAFLSLGNSMTNSTLRWLSWFMWRRSSTRLVALMLPYPRMKISRASSMRKMPVSSSLSRRESLYHSWSTSTSLKFSTVTTTSVACSSRLSIENSWTCFRCASLSLFYTLIHLSPRMCPRRAHLRTMLCLRQTWYETCSTSD